MSPPYVFELLGKKMADRDVVAFLKALKEKVEVEKSVDSEGYYVSSKKDGIELGLDNDFLIRTIFLYSEGKDNHQQFTGTLPRGLTFRDTQEMVRKKLGKPTLSGGGQQDEIFGFIPFHDRYDSVDHQLHIEYKIDKLSLALVTLM